MNNKLIPVFKNEFSNRLNVELGKGYPIDKFYVTCRRDDKTYYYGSDNITGAFWEKKEDGEFFMERADAQHIVDNSALSLEVLCVPHGEEWEEIIIDL
jgi:hypothetical protein